MSTSESPTTGRSIAPARTAPTSDRQRTFLLTKWARELDDVRVYDAMEDGERGGPAARLEYGMALALCALNQIALAFKESLPAANLIRIPREIEEESVAHLAGLPEKRCAQAVAKHGGKARNRQPRTTAVHA